MTAEIETKSARLDTLMVTIQALHVSGKQMTLSVFRQLPTMSAYRDDGSLNEMQMWGLVRYEIKDQGGLWLVASKAGILYRADVDEYRGDVALAEKYLNLAEENRAEYCKWETADIAYRAGDRNSSPYPVPRFGWKQGMAQEYGDEVEFRRNELEVTRRVEASRRVLKALPQLFIAV